MASLIRRTTLHDQISCITVENVLFSKIQHKFCLTQIKGHYCWMVTIVLHGGPWTDVTTGGQIMVREQLTMLLAPPWEGTTGVEVGRKHGGRLGQQRSMGCCKQRCHWAIQRVAAGATTRSGSKERWQHTWQANKPRKASPREVRVGGEATPHVANWRVALVAVAWGHGGGAVLQV